MTIFDHTSFDDSQQNPPTTRTITLIEYADGSLEVVTDKGRRLDAYHRRELALLIAPQLEPKPEPIFVYIGRMWNGNGHKIGLTNKPSRRASQVEMTVLFTFQCQERRIALELEQSLHRLFEGENKALGGECFALTNSDIRWLREMTKLRYFEVEWEAQRRRSSDWKVRTADDVTAAMEAQEKQDWEDYKANRTEDDILFEQMTKKILISWTRNDDMQQLEEGQSE